MRIALFAHGKRHTRTTDSIARGLADVGHSVRVIREGRRRRAVGAALSRRWALSTVRRFRPDVVLVHGQQASESVVQTLSEEFRVVMFTPDCWPSPVLPESLGNAGRVDLLCTVAQGQIAELERAGVKRAVYLAEAHDPRLHHPVETADPAFASEVAFIGSYREEDGALRRELVRAVARHSDLALYGRGWEAAGLRAARNEIFPAQYREICRASEIVLGRDWREDCRWYFSNRLWFTLGCRGFLLTNHVPGLEDLFENHGELVWYRSIGECLDLIEHYRDHPEERARIAAAGHAYVRAHRTYEHFARDLVDLVEGRRAAFPPRRADFGLDPRSRTAEPLACP